MKNKAWILNNKRKKYKLIDFIISCLVILFEYFKYRLCILYLQKEKNMDYSQIISSKQKYSDILDEISKYDESSIRLWFE